MGNLSELCCQQNKKQPPQCPSSSSASVDLTPARMKSQPPPKPQITAESFQIIRQLGKGGFGQVQLVRLKWNQKFYALKILQKQKLQEQGLLDNIMLERFILLQYCHPFLVKLKCSFQNANLLYLLMQWVQGGDIYYYLNKQKTFSQDSVKIIMAQILLALQILHSNHIMYRDLKPQNVLVDKEGHVKLSDFGLSRLIQLNDVSKTVAGTQQYLAPQILLGTGYDKKVDVWSLGIFMYQLLHGHPPFKDSSFIQSLKRGDSDSIRFSSSLSQNAKNIILSLLKFNPNERLGSRGINQIKGHPFFDNLSWQKLVKLQLSSPFKKVVQKHIQARFKTKAKTEYAKAPVLAQQINIQGFQYVDPASESLYEKKFVQHSAHKSIQEKNRPAIHAFSTSIPQFQKFSHRPHQNTHSLIKIKNKYHRRQKAPIALRQWAITIAPKGIPLKLDPFFQYLKNNKLARQIYIKAHQDFSVQKVIDIALRQDIGPDPSYSRARTNKKQIFKQNGSFQNIVKETDKQVYHFDQRNYFSSQKSNDIQEIRNQYKPYEPIQFLYPVLNKRQTLNKYRRRLKDIDIHWRNTPLLSRFIDQNGNFKPRQRTKLSKYQHQKVFKAIQLAKAFRVLPIFGQVNPLFKRAVNSIQDEIQNECCKQISLQTGHIVLRRATDYQKEVQKQQAQNIQSKVLNRPKNTMYKLWFDYENEDENQLNIFTKYQKARMFLRRFKATQLLSKGIDVKKLRQQKEGQEKLFMKIFDRKYGKLSRQAKIQQSKAQQCQSAFNQLKGQLKQLNVNQLIQSLFKQKTRN